MFSIILATIDVSALRPIFLSACKDAEVIIIDSNYNEEKKKDLKEVAYNYKKVTYAPPKKREAQMTYDFISAQNTGLAYAEEPWCFCIGTNWELKPDFFDRLKETIELFTDLYKNRFVVRPIELEQHDNDIRWVSYVRFKQRYLFLPCAPLGATGLRQYIPIITCGAIIAHQETWFTINGFDERYDVGAGWYDNEIFDRFVIMRYPIIFDQQLMVYRLHHQSSFSKEGRDACKKIYDETNEMRNKGYIYAPNPFDLQQLHEIMIKEKGKYLL